MQRTIDYNLALLRQADHLLSQLDDGELSRERPLLFRATIGQHIRHVVEYYQCLLAQRSSGVLNYDRRTRDTRLEQQVGEARMAVDRCSAQLLAITEDMPLTLEGDLPGSEASMPQPTSLARELTYVADHCVHHLAMVRIVLEQELQHVTRPEELGVAAATRNHRDR